MHESPESNLDELLKDSLGTPAAPDFDGWLERNQEAAAWLNPVVTEMVRRRRRRLVGLTNAVIVAVVLVAAGWLLSASENSYARTLDVISRAKSATWTMTSYERWTSADGERTWLEKSQTQVAYRHPGLYRVSSFDSSGQLTRIDIRDTVNDQGVTLYPEDRTFREGTPNFVASFHPQGAFGGVRDILENKSIELAGQKMVEGRRVNVIRYRRPAMKNSLRNSMDLWIDADSQRFIGMSDPGSDVFDPETMEDRDNPPEDNFSKGTILGTVTGQIVFDADLDAALFSLEPPEGFTQRQVRAPVRVSETDLIDWYRAVVRVNNNEFPDSIRASDTDRIWQTLSQDTEERTDAETALHEVFHQHVLNGNRSPVLEFRKHQTVEDSFRYVGRGVRLGQAERLVCWYRLKATGELRAVFGDLSVRVVSPDELPFSVEKVD